MARIVDEIMNRELFGLDAGETSEQALGLILALGITGAPILDEEGRPLGHVSLRDLARARSGATVGDCMTRPAETIAATASIAEAAARMAEGNRHRLVVVDVDGRASGMLSTLDVIRGMLGKPASHPPSFPHRDEATGLAWTNDTDLEAAHVDVAPTGPGILVLVHGGAGAFEQLVWAEISDDLRARVRALVTEPQSDDPLLPRILRMRNLRFRAALTPDPETRWAAIARLRESLDGGCRRCASTGVEQAGGDAAAAS